MTITYGSVCSGIEAATVAWQPLGWKAKWFSEIEQFPSAVLQCRWPKVPNFGDMTTLAPLIRDGLLIAPDILVGGTPCQSFSIAGLRGGLNDHRGQLTFSYVDILNAIDHQRSQAGKHAGIAVWENVPGVLSSKDNAFGCFLGALAGEDEPLIAPGKKWSNSGVVFGPKRTVAWRILDAQYFGLAQRRRRVFVIASSRHGFDPTKVLLEFDGLRRDSAPSRKTWEEVAGTLAARTDGGGFPGTDEACTGYVQPVAFQSSQSGVRLSLTHATLDANNGSRRHNGVVCMAHGQGGAEVSVERSPTLTCNHEAPIAAYSIQAGALRTNPDSGPDGMGVQADRAYTLEARTEVQCTAYAFQPRIGRNGRGVMGDVVNALTAQAGKTGKGDAASCVAYSTTGAGYWQEGIGALRARPQDSHENLAVTAFSCKDYGADAGDVSPTLRAMGHSTSHANAGGQVAVAIRTANTGANGHGISPELAHTLDLSCGQAVFDHLAVRRLMPIECERLQGFPDNHTAVVIRNKPAADGPRYKACGNSMATHVMRWIGCRIERFMPIEDAL